MNGAGKKTRRAEVRVPVIRDGVEYVLRSTETGETFLCADVAPLLRHLAAGAEGSWTWSARDPRGFDEDAEPDGRRPAWTVVVAPSHRDVEFWCADNGRIPPGRAGSTVLAVVSEEDVERAVRGRGPRRRGDSVVVLGRPGGRAADPRALEALRRAGWWT